MLGLWIGLTVAVAKPATTEAYETPPHVGFWRDKVDWEVAQHEAVARLAEYITVDSVNPPGNEQAAVDWMAKVLEQEEIEHRTVELSLGRSSLIARVSGIGADTPLCLMHHIDTVGFDEERWSNTFAHGPLSGAMSEGFVWGRGALDMKGMGVLELMTLIWLKRIKVPLIRDVVLLAVADGEGVNQGAEQLAQMWDEIGCSYVIGEGGLGVHDAIFEGQTVHTISVAEKGVLWLDVHADGSPGRGSVPRAGEAPDRLQEAMAAIAKYKAKLRRDPTMKQFLRDIGSHEAGKSGLFPWARLKQDPAYAATLRDTIHLTGVRGPGALPDEVPGRVSATYDCRMVPGTTTKEPVERIEKLLRKLEGITLEVRLERDANASPIDDPLYERIAHYATESRSVAVAAPLLSVGHTDALLLRPEGVKAYGYVPFEVTKEVADAMHGPDERVPMAQVREGLRRLFSIVLDFAGNP